MAEKKHIVEVKHHSYQPSKAELEADARIQTTPERLAKSVLSPVTVKEIKKPQRKI